MITAAGTNRVLRMSMVVGVLDWQLLRDRCGKQAFVCRHEGQSRQTGDGKHVVGGQRAGKLQGVITAEMAPLCQIEAALNGRSFSRDQV